MKYLLASDRPGQPDMLVMLFGSGTTGGPIASALERQSGQKMRTVGYDWSSQVARTDARSDMTACVGAKHRNRQVAIIWSAGRSGMGSTTEAMDMEVSLVRELVDFASDLAGLCAGVQFHLLSSAGAMFEGQAFVDNSTAPRPTRPYGVGKLAQEEYLLAAAARVNGLVCTVYRPSSVYGFSPDGRLGLITSLLRNGVRHTCTRIVGRKETLRDYVYSDDIGRFVADRVMAGALPNDQPLLLASGKSTTIGEIVNEVESLLNKPLYLQYDPRPDNSDPMGFRPSAIPADFLTTDLCTGVRRVASSLQASLQ